MQKQTVKIAIEGLSNTGRTAMAIKIASVLKSHGIEVQVQDQEKHTHLPLDFPETALSGIGDRVKVEVFTLQAIKPAGQHDGKFVLDEVKKKTRTTLIDPNPNKVLPDALGSPGTKDPAADYWYGKEPAAATETKPDWTPDQPLSGEPHVVLETTHGRIVLELFPDRAPQTVANFLQYVKDGFYDGVIFHRVIPGFMIQGGGFKMDRSGEGKGKLNQQAARAPVPNEANNGLKNDRYSLAMARTNEVNSGASQFFINVADNAFLNFTAPNARGFGYAVFGQVVVGANVVDLIAKQKTGRVGFHDDVPVEDVIITSARLIGG